MTSLFDIYKIGVGPSKAPHDGTDVCVLPVCAGVE